MKKPLFLSILGAALIGSLVWGQQSTTGGSGVSQTPWASDIDAASHNITSLGKINGVKVYRALLTQAGTAAPVATVLENTLGGVPVWAQLTDGLDGKHKLTLAGAFPVAKTMVFIQSQDATVLMTYEVGYSTSPNNIVIGETADGLFNNTPIEILVYP